MRSRTAGRPDEITPTRFALNGNRSRTRMSLPPNRMELCVLASGSSGNCAAVRTPAGVLLIDAGLGPRMAAERLKGTGVSVADVSAVCLTHLDRDHFNPNWVGTWARQRVRIFCHAIRAGDLLRLAQAAC